jgi:hypothetical protein
MRHHCAQRSQGSRARLGADAPPHPYSEEEGLRELTGNVLASNQRMLGMCRALGFEIATDPEDISIRKVRLKLPRLSQ